MSANPLRNQKQAILKWSRAGFDARPYLKKQGAIAPYYTTPLGGHLRDPRPAHLAQEVPSLERRKTAGETLNNWASASM